MEGVEVIAFLLGMILGFALFPIVICGIALWKDKGKDYFTEFED